MASKWAMFIAGQNTIHEMKDEITALREANKLNQRILKWRNDDPSRYDPYIVAVAIERENIPAYCDAMENAYNGSL